MLVVKSALPYSMYLPKYDDSVKLKEGNALENYEKDLDSDRLEIGEKATVIHVNPPSNRQMIYFTQRHGIDKKDPGTMAYLVFSIEMAQACVESITGYEDLDEVHEDVLSYIGRQIVSRANLDRTDEGN